MQLNIPQSAFWPCTNAIGIEIPSERSSHWVGLSLTARLQPSCQLLEGSCEHHCLPLLSCLPVLTLVLKDSTFSPDNWPQ